MLTDAIRDSTGVTVRVELLVETAPKVRESLALAPPPVTVVVEEHELDPLGGDAARRHRRQGRRHLGVGHAERPLHVRPVRHRCVEPLRPRRRALGRREPRPVLQPAVHLRPRRSGQDPPPPRDRPPRPHGVPQQAGAVRVHRDVHERVRRRHPGQGDAELQAALPRPRRPPDRRHPVPRAHPGAPGGVLPHVQPAPRRGRPDRHLVRPGAEVDRQPRGPPPHPLRVGPHHRRPAARVRDPPRHPPQEGRVRAPRWHPARGPRLHRHQHQRQHPRARGRPHPGRRLLEPQPAPSSPKRSPSKVLADLLPPTTPRVDHPAS